MRIAMWLLLCGVLAGTALAQVPNGGFETWAGTDPGDWVTSNSIVAVNVTSTTTAHSGSYAARGDVAAVSVVTIQPVLQTGPGGTGFAYTGRPAAVTGWLQFNGVGDDGFAVNAWLTKNGTGVAVAAALLKTQYSSYTQFSVPFTYLTAETPDVCILQFMIGYSGTSTGVHAGSYFLLDDVALSGTTGIDAAAANVPVKAVLSQNYPNPFNPETSIDVTVPGASPRQVSLQVFDMLGREVATLMDGAYAPGRHTVRFDGTKMASGLYVYRLTSGTQTESRTMMLVR